MTPEKLNTAIQLIESGNKQAAVPVLREIIKENAGDEDAWFLLSTCMDQVEHKKFCLQSVLTINPANQQAREALADLTQPAPTPVPVAFQWTQSESAAPSEAQPLNTVPEKMEWERAESDRLGWGEAEADEIVLQRLSPQKLTREKMEWERTESERFEEEDAERQKIERKRIEREKAELERVETLKMEWERTEAERLEHEKEAREKVERKRVDWEQAGQQKNELNAPFNIDWGDFDEVQPVSRKPLKQKTVKSPVQPASRRKTRSKRRSIFPLVVGMIALFVMLFTVCVVFLAQLLPSAH